MLEWLLIDCLRRADTTMSQNRVDDQQINASRIFSIIKTVAMNEPSDKDVPTLTDRVEVIRAEMCRIQYLYKNSSDILTTNRRRSSGSHLLSSQDDFETVIYWSKSSPGCNIANREHCFVSVSKIHYYDVIYGSTTLRIAFRAAEAKFAVHIEA